MTKSSTHTTPADLAQLQAAVSHFHRAEYKQAINLLPGIQDDSPYYFDALHLQGVIYYQMQEYNKSLGFLQRAQTLQPDNAQLLNALASCYLAQNLLQEAIDTYQKANAVTQTRDTLRNLTIARLRYAQHLIDARHYREALSQLDLVQDADVKEQKIDRLLLKAFALQQTGNFEDALSTYEDALQTTGQFGVEILAENIKNSSDEKARLIAKIQYNLAIVNLTLGNYQIGWPGYRARPSLLDNPAPISQNKLPNDLSKSNVLITNDQGLGDELFFLRYAKLVAQRGGSISYQPNNKLLSLLSHCSDVPLNPLPVYKEYDYVLAVGDLPYCLDQKDIIPPPITLIPGEEKLKAVNAQLKSFGPPPYLGISWRAGTTNTDNNLATTIRKSVPLNELMETLNNFNGTLCVLQRLPDESELSLLSQMTNCKVVDYSDFNDNLEDMTCLLAVLDDYIAVSNTNTHLRGSLGKRCGVLIPHPAEWRWKNTGDNTPWYENFTLYRQKDSDWTDALSQIKQRIDSLEHNG